MTFLNDNQNFIRFKLQNDLKGKTPLERAEAYLMLQGETRNRIITSQKKSALLSEKIKNFKELFETVAEFEYEYLLLSVFWDQDAEKIISDIGTQVIKVKSIEYNDRYSLVAMINFNLVNLNKGGMQSYLSSFFREKFEKPNLELHSKEVSRNDFISEACTWLEESVKKENKEFEILCVLIHFCKAWQVFYCNPYDQIKGVLLLHGMISLLKRISEDEANRLFMSFNFCRELLKETFNSLVLPPFWDEETFRVSDGQELLPGYTKKLTEFKGLYKTSKITIDSKIADIFSEDFTKYYKSNKSLQEKLSETIFANISSGKLPNKESLDNIEQLYSKSKAEGGIDSQKLKWEVYRRTYSLAFLKLRSKW